jgi:hypothetical protein
MYVDWGFFEEEEESFEFPYVVILGEIDQAAILKLQREPLLIAFDEVRIELEVLNRLESAYQSLPAPPFGQFRRLAADEGLVSELFGGRDPSGCRAFLVDIENVLPGWYIAKELVSRGLQYPFMIFATWHTTIGYLKTHEHYHK